MGAKLLLHNNLLTEKIVLYVNPKMLHHHDHLSMGAFVFWEGWSRCGEVLKGKAVDRPGL